MIIEIGTSDFRTLAGQIEGLFIEPVKEHFDRLPDCNKENIAISNYEGEIDIFYIPAEVIKQHNIPNWTRGCNSINEPHPSLKQWNHLITSHKVKVERIKTVLERHNIKSISLLKIDTEGHDCVILNDYLDTVETLPETIQFEANTLSVEKDVKAVVKRLESKGYYCSRVKFDMVCSR